MTIRSVTRSLTLLSPLPQKRVVERYTIALLLAILAVLLRALLDPILGHVAVYTTVYMAVAWCAVVCGMVPAALGALSGFMGIFYWFVDPRHTLSLRPSEIQGVIGFFLVCAVLVSLGEANRRKQMKLDSSIQALTNEAQERKKAEQELQQAHNQLDLRVTERTAALSQALSSLKSEVDVREQTEERLRHLSLRLMTTQDEERRHIARELHDSAGQTLAAVKMTIASFELAGAKAADLPKMLKEINALVDEVVQEIRTTSYLLHPPLLDEAGIASAARWFVDGFAKRSGIEVSCDIPEAIERGSKGCELVLFRVLQESLTNVHRHSGASKARVSLKLENDSLKLEVADNGCGMSDQRLQQFSLPGREGVGIAGMRERVRELGGGLDIRSGKTGTTVSVMLPAPQPSRLQQASLSIRSV